MASKNTLSFKKTTSVLTDSLTYSLYLLEGREYKMIKYDCFDLQSTSNSAYASSAILQLISDQKELICGALDFSKFKQTPLATWEVLEENQSVFIKSRSASISLDYKPTRAKWRLLTVTTNDSTGLPYLQMRMSQDCKIRAIRRIRYDNLGRSVQIENLDPVSLEIKSTEPQNPRLEFSGANRLYN